VEHPRIQWRIDAAEMTWDVEAQHWIAEHAERRVFEADSIEIQELDSFAMPFTIHHDAIVRLQRGVDELTIDEVDDYIATLKAGGKDTRMQEIDYYGAWAFPFSNVVIIFIAVPFASVRRRGGIAVNVAAAMVVAFGYIAFTEVSKAIGLASDVSPAVIGWSANAVFLLVALFAMMVLRR
jgi:lipopolysaccharide export LptBFGC system permease protein LptF